MNSLQTCAIMARSIGRCELTDADVVIRPQMPGINVTDFQDRHLAALGGREGGGGGAS